MKGTIKASQLPKVKVKLIAGKGGSVSIDGVEVPHVAMVDIHAEARGVPTIRIDMFAGEVEVDIEGAEATLAVKDTGPRGGAACTTCLKDNATCGENTTDNPSPMVCGGWICKPRKPRMVSHTSEPQPPPPGDGTPYHKGE